MSDQPPSPETLLAAALEISEAGERHAYLDRACGDDAALRQEIESLLTAHEQAGGFMSATVGYGFTPPEDRKMTIKVRYYTVESLLEKHCTISSFTQARPTGGNSLCVALFR